MMTLMLTFGTLVMALTLGTTSLAFAESQKTAIDFFKERGRISEEMLKN